MDLISLYKLINIYNINVIYSPLFGLLVKIVYPLRRLIDIIYKLIPINFLHKIAVILRQEKIRRISYEK